MVGPILLYLLVVAGCALAAMSVCRLVFGDVRRIPLVSVSLTVGTPLATGAARQDWIRPDAHSAASSSSVTGTASAYGGISLATSENSNSASGVPTVRLTETSGIRRTSPNTRRQTDMAASAQPAATSR